MNYKIPFLAVMLLLGASCHLSAQEVLVDFDEVFRIAPDIKVAVPSNGKPATDSRYSKRKISSSTKSSPTRPTSIQVKLKLDEYLIEMKDGSRMVGRLPQMTTLPFDVDYGKIEVPLKQIKTVSKIGNQNQFQIIFLNGDVLTGELTLKEIKLATDYGELTIAREKIMRLTVGQNTPRPKVEKVSSKKPMSELEKLKQKLAKIEAQMKNPFLAGSKIRKLALEKKKLLQIINLTKYAEKLHKIHNEQIGGDRFRLIDRALRDQLP